MKYTDYRQFKPLPTSSDFDRHIATLQKTVDEVKIGESPHITRMMVLLRLLYDEDSCQRFFIWMLSVLISDLRSGKSLALKHLLPVNQKIDLALKAMGAVEHWKRPNSDELLDKIDDLLEDNWPDWKRISRRASRRKMDDPDLLVLAQVVKFCNIYSLPHLAYWAVQDFCCDYHNRRYKFTYPSITRIEGVITFLTQEKNRLY